MISLYKRHFISISLLELLLSLWKPLLRLFLVDKAHLKDLESRTNGHLTLRFYLDKGENFEKFSEDLLKWLTVILWRWKSISFKEIEGHKA